MIKFIHLVLLFSLPIQALQILQPTNDNQVIQQQLDTPQLNTPLSAELLLTKLKTSAKRGDARSQFSLANMYYNGINVTKDDKLAFYWYLQVAEQDYASAQFNVANSYYYGLGVGKDLEQALSWYEKAALLGYEAAQLNLAKLYEAGIGVDRDLTLAQQWYEAAVNQFDPEAQFYLADFYEREGDSNKALDCYKESANQGFVDAQARLSMLYRIGYLVKQDDVKALYWALMAANQDDAQSQFLVGVIYQKSAKVKRNLPSAIAWYKKAAEQEHPEARYHLALLQLKGNGIDKDVKQALATLLDLSSKGHQVSQYQLYLIYNKGDVMVKNEMLAKTYLLKAAKAGYVEAQYQLGKSFFNQDMVREAAHYLELAANQNNASAVKLLKKLQSKQKQSIIQNVTNTAKPVVAIKPVMAETLQQSVASAIDPNLDEQLFDNTTSLIPDQDEIAKSLSHHIKSNINLETLLANVEQGNPIAQYNLSALYYKGEVVRKDNRAAFILMRQSANQGITQSQNTLAIMYINGIGSQTDYNKAYYWASITTRKGSQQGKRILLYLIVNL